jgi:polyhydroxybutyrate depolymerase
MKSLRCFFALFLLAFPWGPAFGADTLARREWTVDGTTREALVYVPPGAQSAAAPVIFAFHGHYGTMNFAAQKFDLHTLWPEALVVYPQGLPTVSKLVDPMGKFPGWQTLPGDYGDRDLKFFDAMLATLRKEYHVDDKRIYAMGHSNGGLFTYLLWSARGDQLAAIAPCAAVAARGLSDFKPKPVFHVAGENDPIGEEDEPVRRGPAVGGKVHALPIEGKCAADHLHSPGKARGPGRCSGVDREVFPGAGETVKALRR